MFKTLRKKIKYSRFKKFFKFKLKRKLINSTELLVNKVSEMLDENILQENAPISNINSSREINSGSIDEPIKVDKINEDVLIKPLFKDLTNRLLRNLQHKKIEKQKNKTLRETISLYNIQFSRINQNLNVKFSLPMCCLKEYHIDYINALMVKQNKIDQLKATSYKHKKNELVNKNTIKLRSNNDKKKSKSLRKSKLKNNVFIEKRLSSFPIDKDFYDSTYATKASRNSIFEDKNSKIMIFSIISSIFNPFLGMNKL